ncbi:MAG: threonine--tRNA ligase, partial [Candidatus Margulisbacteria bacterium]|nr:threonine--tRNA ligase [Candidatus Margulisiibacteriota bacterium]
DAKATFYKNADFIDLWRGPHIRYTKELKAFKLLSTAGAYWKGSEKNKMLTRIYGTAFNSKEELEKYLELREEATKRDHRKLGKELDLFSFHQEAPANVFFHPKGVVLFNKLIEFARVENTKRGYQEIMTPLILSEELWHRSGHYDNYKEHMYFTKVDERDFAVKPMNCPGGLLIFKEKKYSYRDLPLKVGEFGRVHRHEKSGVTHGLFRVRTFVQDDAHIFCAEEQIEAEIISVIDQVFFTYKKFGFKDFEVELSTMPEKAIGSKEIWRKAEEALKGALKTAKINYRLNEGDGAFYGPKIDFHIKDSLNRKWQCGTIQLDFSMPERFKLSYVGSDGSEHQPVMIHRAIYGSIERFMGILIEHFGGKFPFWLSPVQARLLPVSEKYLEYAKKIKGELLPRGLRVEIDDSSEKLGYKIRQAQMQKVPYMLIVGEKEAEASKVSVRQREAGDIGAKSLPDFMKMIDKLGENVV